VRLFVAIELVQGVRSALQNVQSRLGASCQGVRWIPAEQLHVTLKFLGDVRDGDVPAVAEAMAGAVAGVTPFEVEVAGCGCFPPRGPARIVWAGLREDTGTLPRMAADVDAAMEHLGFERERRPFSGHITIGRVREDRPQSGIREATQASAYDPVSQTVGAVTLMSSVLSPKGPTYTAVRTVTLGQA